MLLLMLHILDCSISYLLVKCFTITHLITISAFAQHIYIKLSFISESLDFTAFPDEHIIVYSFRVNRLYHYLYYPYKEYILQLIAY
jgi:hypothetical protein